MGVLGEGGLTSTYLHIQISAYLKECVVSPLHSRSIYVFTYMNT